MARITKIVLIVFGINLILRLDYFALNFNRYIVSQWLPARLDEITLSLINGQQYTFPTAWSSFHLILGLVYLPLKYLGLLDYRLIAFAVFNALITSLSAVFIYKMTKNYIITGLFSLYYPLYYVNLLTIPESLYTFILIVLFYLLTKHSFTVRTAVLTGVIVSIGLIIKPVIVPLIPLILLWKMPKFRYLAVFGAVFMVIYMVAALVNSRFDRRGNFAVIGNGGVNFVMAWCEPQRISYKLANGEYRWYEPPVFKNRYDLQELTYDVPFYNQVFYYREGLNCILRHPVKLLTNFKHVFNIFNSIFYPNLLMNPIHTTFLILWKFLTIPLIIAFFAFPFIHKRKRKEWWLGVAYLSSLFISVYLSNPGEERYIIPYYFVLILFGGQTLISYFKV